MRGRSPGLGIFLSRQVAALSQAGRHPLNREEDVSPEAPQSGRHVPSGPGVGGGEGGSVRQGCASERLAVRRGLCGVLGGAREGEAMEKAIPSPAELRPL